MLKWLLILWSLYVAVDAHAYGGRPQPARPARPAYSARPSSPGTYSYVRPAARAPSPQRPAVKYVAPVQISPAASYVVSSSSKSSSYSGSESVPSAAKAKPGNNGGVTYYTTESVFYTTQAYDNGYYAEHIYYSTEQPIFYGTTEPSSYDNYNSNNNNNEAVYSYVDPTTYFGEDTSHYFAPGNDYVTSPAGGNDYVAGPAADYGTSPAGGSEYVDAGYIPEATPANYVEPTANYYTLAPVVEEYSTDNAGYYTETGPVYDGQPGYSAANNIYGPGANVVNDYATAVPPPLYYSADQTAPNSPFFTTNVQHGG